MKAPAFQFYVRDWLLSRTVSRMTGDEVKAYLFLLCEAWLEEPRATLPNDDEELARMAQTSTEKWLRVKGRVMANWELRDNRWVNLKLLGVSQKQCQFRNWGKMGGNPLLTENEPKEVNPIVNPIVNGGLNPQVNLATASSSATDLSNKRMGFVKPTSLEVSEYSKSIGFSLDGEYFCDHYETRGWKLKGGVSMKDWKASVRTWKKNNILNVSTSKPKFDATKIYSGEDQRRKEEEEVLKMIQQSKEAV